MISPLEILSKLMPIRQTWGNEIITPILFALLFIAIGFLIGKKSKSILFCLTLPFLLILLLPIIASDIEAYVLVYSFFYITILVFWGWCLSKKIIIQEHKKKEISEKQITGLIFLFLIFICLMYIPIFNLNSPQITGADSWSHITFLHRSEGNLGLISSSPIFQGESWHYLPLFYVEIYQLKEVLNLPIETTGIFFVLMLCMFNFVSTFIFFRAIGFRKGVSFLSSISSTILIYEIAPNAMFFSLLALFLYTLCKKKYAVTAIIFVALLHTYYLYVPILLIILTAYTIIPKLEQLMRHKAVEKKENYLLKIEEKYLFLIMFFFLSLILFMATRHDATNWNFYTLISSIPLNPLNIFTFFALLFLPISLAYIRQSKEIKDKTLLYAILILLLNSLFYYLNIYQFHIRYLSEISAYLVLIPCFFSIVLNTPRVKNIRKITALLLILCLFVPLTLSTIRTISHAESSIKTFESSKIQFANLTENIDNRTFLFDPCDFNIRYFLFSTRNYVEAVNYQPNEQCQSNIITTIDQKLDFVGLSYPKDRLDLVYIYLQVPTRENLDKLTKKYPFDFALIKKRAYSSIFEDKDTYTLIKSNEYYNLYLLNKDSNENSNHTG